MKKNENIGTAIEMSLPAECLESIVFSKMILPSEIFIFASSGFRSYFRCFFGTIANEKSNIFI